MFFIAMLAEGMNPNQAVDKIPAILSVIQNEQDELKQFDSELEKISLV